MGTAQMAQDWGTSRNSYEEFTQHTLRYEAVKVGCTHYYIRIQRFDQVWGVCLVLNDSFCGTQPEI
jgi:hypothetical protein